MNHVILGWGSLLWDEGPCPMPLASAWNDGGPSVPLEFSRVSATRDGALTLVIDPESGQECPTSFALSQRKFIEDAICDLRCREGTMLKRIGFVDLASGEQRCNVEPRLADVLRRWAEERGFTSVIWTDLPSNFNEDGRGPFGLETATAYLRSLNPAGARRAREYFDRAPQAVRTPLREYLQRADWWPSYGAA